MTYKSILSRLPEMLRPKLPPHLQDFQYRFGMGLVKVYYGWHRIHYEVWCHTKIGRIEIGLHFEADKDTNAELLRRFDKRMIEIKAQLGECFELEPWEKGWARLYETMPMPPLSEELLSPLADRLAQVITVLQPIYEEEA